MKIGDLVYDDGYELHGIIVGDDGDLRDFVVRPKFVVLYEDGNLGEANAVDLELI